MTAPVVLHTPTFDESSEGLTYIWENASDSILGTAAKPGAKLSGCDIATANTDFPIGVVVSVAKQYEGVKVVEEGIGNIDKPQCS